MLSRVPILTAMKDVMPKERSLKMTSHVKVIFAISSFKLSSSSNLTHLNTYMGDSIQHEIQSDVYLENTVVTTCFGL